ncbi:MAG: FliG C-terminal domain-containing protein [Treponema sp.]|uniref:FliG C-terminal domain-containing protein n=1 Tax=Treponema sp. TaxID=166 RepID=UPI003FA1C459
MVECLAADIQNKIEQHTQVPYTELGSIDFIEKFITSLSPGEISDSPLDSMLNVLMDTKHVNMLEYMLTLIRETNPAAYTALKKHIFLFEDIVKLDDLSIQKMLRETYMEYLTRALKTASPALQAKIEGNMSARAGAMLREEMGFMHPISSRDVREAQQKIVWTLRRLADGGEVVLP